MALLSPLIATWHDTDATAYQEDPFAAARREKGPLCILLCRDTRLLLIIPLTGENNRLLSPEITSLLFPP